MNWLRSALILLLAVGTSAAALAASGGDKRERGATLFAESGCQHCHTIQHNGGKKGPDLSGVGRRLKDAQIKAQILKGGHEMPSFAEILQESETDDLVAYLHSCRDKGK